MKTVIKTSNSTPPVGPYSQAILWNDLLFISGQIPLDPISGKIVSDKIDIQTLRVMDNIGSILESAGMSYSNILKATLFIKRIDDFQMINEVYGSYFSDFPPARETVEVSALPRDVDIQISVIAGKF